MSARLSDLPSLMLSIAVALALGAACVGSAVAPAYATETAA